MTTIHFTQSQLIDLLSQVIREQGQHTVSGVSFCVTEKRDALDRPLGSYDVQCDVEIATGIKPLATGGMLQRPVLTNGNEGKEVVIPLNPHQTIHVDLLLPSQQGTVFHFTPDPPAPIIINMHVYGVQDAESFRAQHGSIARDLAEQLRRATQHEQHRPWRGSGGEIGSDCNIQISDY